MNLINTLCTNMPLEGFHGKPVVWGQLNRQMLEETMSVAETIVQSIEDFKNYLVLT